MKITRDAILDTVSKCNDFIFNVTWARYDVGQIRLAINRISDATWKEIKNYG